MDNASKNAGDMIGSLQMQYNRGRQAAITNELVDIITGLQSSRRLVRAITDACPRCQRLVISERSLESAIDYVPWRDAVISGFLICQILSRPVPRKRGASSVANYSCLRPCNLDRTSDSGVLHIV